MKQLRTEVRYLDAPEFDRFWREDERGQITVLNRIKKID